MSEKRSPQQHKNKKREKRIKLASSGDIPAEARRLLDLQLAVRDPGEDYERRFWRDRNVAPTGHLWPEQRRSLRTIRKLGGLLGPIGCGFGKGLISMLAPISAKAKRPLLVIPANLRTTFKVEREKFAKAGWKVAYNYTVRSYEQLSRPDSTDMLMQLNPDFIFFDEAHNLANAAAARVGRIGRFMEKRPTVKVAAVSGSITHRSILDYAHISMWALKQYTPLPINETWLRAWADVIDEQKDATPSQTSWAYLRSVLGEDAMEDQPAARKAYGTHLRTTYGVVSTGDKVISTGLQVGARRTKMPSEVLDAMHDIEFRGIRPDHEEELVSPLDRARHLQTARGGFFYRWVWPEGVPDEEWLDARSSWHKVVRQVLDYPFQYIDPRFPKDRRAVDTEKLVRVAHRKGYITHAKAEDAWKAWRKLRKRYAPEPPKEVFWISDYQIQDAKRWARALTKSGGRGIIWYLFEAQMNALQSAGIPVYPKKGHLPDASEPVVGLSLLKHGTGMNLQAWDHNLVLTWHTSGRLLEQVLARTHRNGQESDTVRAFFYTHDLEAVKRTILDARYIQDSLQTPQRLLRATYEDSAVALFPDQFFSTNVLAE